MAAEGSVSEIVNKEAERQLSDLQTGLTNAADQLERIGRLAKGITIDFKGAKDLATLNELQDKVIAATKKMEKAQRDFADEIDRAQVKEEAAVNKMLAAQMKKAQKEEEILNRMIAAEEKASAKAIAAQEKRAKKEEETLNKMIAAEQKAAEAKQKIIDKSAKESEKAAQREAQAIGKLTNDYEILKKAYIDQANYAKQLGVTLGTNNKQFKDASASAMVMYDRLLKVEKAVGQAQRQVGQYNQAAFAMQQILREGPAFANSFATGIMAISNNIPVLIDEIKRMQIANEELKASGATTIPIWKTLLGSIFSPMGLMSLALTGFTFLATKVDLFSQKTDKAKESADAFAESLKAVGQAAKENETSQVQAASALAKIAGDETKSNELRTKAFNELQKMYPQYLENLKAEDMLRGGAYDALQKIKEEIDYKTRLQGVEEAGVALRKRAVELEAQISGAETLEDQYKFKQALEEVNKQIEQNAKDYQDYKQIALTFPTAEEKKPKEKKTASVDGSVMPTNEAVQAAYDASIKELQITVDKNKAIYEDEKLSQEERLKAYSIYNAAVLSMMQQQRDKEIQIEIDKLQNIQEQLKTAKGQEKQNLYDAAYAGNIRIATLNKAFEADTAATTEKSKKDILNIVYSANEEWIKSESFRNEKMKELTIGLYMQDEALLIKQLQNKEITQRQFDKKMRDLQRSQGVALLSDDIALYESILKNDNITAERRLDIQKKLNAANKQLTQMRSGSSVKKSGRLTDGLAEMLGITDEGAMQEFYDRSIQLANQAADAIIAAKQRQFDAEYAMLDKQKEGIENNYNTQLDYINATTRDETERANKIAQLQAQKATQEAELDAKKREIAKRQAQFEKGAAIASIIQSTAIAIAGALKYGVAAPAIIALITAAGATQLAIAANAPIPAYAEGTDGHKGGLFFAGDGGEPEYIKAPNKKGYWSASTTTLYNEPKGTTVTPMSKFVDVVGNYSPVAINQGIDYEKLAKLIGQEVTHPLWQHGENLSRVFMASRPKQQKIDMRETVIQLQRLGK